MQSPFDNDVVRHHSRSTGLTGDSFVAVSTIPPVTSHHLGVRGPGMQDNVTKQQPILRKAHHKLRHKFSVPT